MSSIVCGSKVFMTERIVAVETKTDPKQPGWLDDCGALVLVDAGDKGCWISLTNDEWHEFQQAIAMQPQRPRSTTEML